MSRTPTTRAETYPVINRTPAELKAALGDAPIKVLDVKPGDAVMGSDRSTMVTA